MESFVIFPVLFSTVVGCIVTPLNPTTLTAAGGVLHYGAKNITVQCNCTENGSVVKIVRWYNSDGIKLISPRHLHFNSSVPHFTRVIDYDNSNIILVIPMFAYFFAGVYTCGKRAEYPPGAPNATINFTLYGKVMYLCC